MLIDWKTCSYNNLWEFSSAITYQLYTWEQTYKHVKMSNCYRPCKQVSTSLSIKPISGCVSTACPQLLDKSGTIKLLQSCNKFKGWQQQPLLRFVPTSLISLARNKFRLYTKLFVQYYNLFTDLLQACCEQKMHIIIIVNRG